MSDAGRRSAAGAGRLVDPRRLTRRSLLRGAAGVGVSAAAAALLPACGSGSKSGTEVTAPPETTTIRMAKGPLSCFAAQALAADFLKHEGFTDVQYLDIPPPEHSFKLAAGALDLHMYPAPLAAVRVDAGDPIVMLSGVQVGCWQLFGTDGITSIRDLKTKVVATSGPNTPDGIFLAVTLANVGLDIRRDLLAGPTVTGPAEAAQIFVRGDADGIMILPPFSYELIAKRIGHVIVDSMMDRPWSQYFCCMATVNRDFMVKNPVATKRALRAMLKAADVVAKDPAQGARALVDRGFIPEKQYDVVLDDLRMMPYDVWRKFDPADTLRFYALRLKEAGLITSTPEEILTRGTDFRFLRELKKELASS